MIRLISMKTLRSLFLIPMLCFLTCEVFGQEETVTWHHDFIPEDITAENYNGPLTFEDVDGGSPITWNFSATWQYGNPTFSGTDVLVIGSSSNAIYEFSLTTNNVPGVITKVTVKVFSFVNGTYKITTSIDGHKLGDTQFFGMNPADYTFENTNNYTGELKIKCEQYNAYNRICLKSIEIEYVPTAPEPDEATITIGESGYATYASNKALDFRQGQVTDDEDNDATIVPYVVTSYYTNSTVGILKAGGNFGSEKIVAANTGLIIKGDPGTYHVKYSDTVGNYFANLLVPVTKSITLQPNDENYTNFVLGIKDGTVNFYKLQNAGSFGPNKAYLQIPTIFISSNNINSFSLMELEEEDISGIDEINEKATADDWYTLNGIRIDKPNRKGIYLHGGKKVVVP